MTTDFLIIGQGIGGTLLAHFLLQAGSRVHVVDWGGERSASQVAAGIINPLTSRRFVKSWRVDELIPFARETYRAIERQFGIEVYRERELIRAIFTVQEENDWLSRAGDPAYASYMDEVADLGTFEGRIRPARGYGGVRQAAQVDLAALCEAYRARFIREGSFVREYFDHKSLKLTEEGVKYKDILARQLVFCEGYLGARNPFFRFLPFQGDKGEVLIIKVPGAGFDKIIKHRVFIVPLKDERYWTGATYLRHFEDDRPTGAGREMILDRLKDTLLIPFEIVGHRSAVRPTVSDRRPLLGRHPEFSQLALFNGLGTKGASLGPFFASQMACFLTEGRPLDEEVDIRRFR